MNEATLIALALVLFAWAVLTKRIESFNISGPLFLTLGGFRRTPVGGSSASTWKARPCIIWPRSRLHCCCSRTPRPFRSPLRRDLPLTARLLGIGLPLSIVAGTLIALVLFPSLPFALAGLIAASLAPTDAALRPR
jgi:hypothetical protein